MTGPWLHELSVRVRDILADGDASRRIELAVQWGRIEEFAISLKRARATCHA